MEEQRKYHSHHQIIARNAHNVSANIVSEMSHPDTDVPLLSTESCALIQGGILLAFIFGLIARWEKCKLAKMYIHNNPNCFQIFSILSAVFECFAKPTQWNVQRIDFNVDAILRHKLIWTHSKSFLEGYGRNR